MVNIQPATPAELETPTGNLLEQTLGSIAARDFGKAKVFKKYGLDFCCGGKKNIVDACAEKSLNAEVVIAELLATDEAPMSRPFIYRDWEPGFLAEYIVNVHHGYVRKHLPDLVMYANKVMNAHGKVHPELAEINKLVLEINVELSEHMLKEEKILFPYIKALSEAHRNLTPLASPGFGKVENPICMMEAEHEFVGQRLEKIRSITNNYTLPAGACASYNFLYRLLAEFEEDLHLHVHLENNILFPKAIELQKAIQQ